MRYFLNLVTDGDVDLPLLLLVQAADVWWLELLNRSRKGETLRWGELVFVFDRCNRQNVPRKLEFLELAAILLLPSDLSTHYYSEYTQYDNQSYLRIHSLEQTYHSGHWISGKWCIKTISGNDPQHLAVITYYSFIDY